MYNDIYFRNYTASDREYERAHARMSSTSITASDPTDDSPGHCIEALRLSLMCQANTALYTFKWDEGNTHKKQALTSKAKRQCVKWDPVHEWASSRTVGLNPEFYRPGKGPVKKAT
jgi:hypothetical protein